MTLPLPTKHMRASQFVRARVYPEKISGVYLSPPKRQTQEGVYIHTRNTHTCPLSFVHRLCACLLVKILQESAVPNLKVGLGISQTNAFSQLNPVQGISSIVLLWKRNNLSVVM